MPKRKDKSKSKYRIKSRNNNNKNKNSINIKIIGGQGGGGGGAGSSSYIPHPSHHQDIDYDRIRNILYQPNPRSTLTQETVNPPPVHQAIDITPNVSTNQNVQLTPSEIKPLTKLRTSFDYDENRNVGLMSAQTAPMVNPMHFKKEDDDFINLTDIFNKNVKLTKSQEKRNINNATYDEYRDLKAKCEAAGNDKKYKNTIKGKNEMMKWINEHTKSG